MIVEAVGFDLDNTLYDQGQYMRSFFRDAAGLVAEKFSTDIQSAEDAFLDVWQKKTSFYAHLFDDALKELGIWSEVAVRELVGSFRAHDTPLSLYPGARPVLSRLAPRVPLFLVTDGFACMQKRKVERLGIGEFFQTLVYTGDYGKEWHKPSQLPFQHAAEQLAIEPRNCWYVGDNPLCDFAGAKEIGMTTVRVRTGPFAAHENAGVPNVTYDVECLADVEQLLTTSGLTVR